MGLEADDGRPETSPPLRRGVQTADRAVVRERQAIPGDQGRVRHRAIDPAALGPRHPQQRLHPGHGQPHARAERAGRTGEARPAAGDGGGRFRTSGAGIRTKVDGTRADETKLANLPDREFDGYAPHTHLASDLTYVRVDGVWAYVCLLAGLANRGIAGHSVGQARDAGLVLAAFATLDFPLRDVQVFHTGRGGEFDDTRIDELLDVFDIKGSLSRKGNPYDNAVAESMNRLLKKELVYRNHYTTIEQLRHDLNDYVWWSDDQWLHSTLGYRSPKEFTEQGLVL